MLLLTGTNLISVRAFGEFEFWFASIKVAAIVAFIVIAVVYVVTGGGLGQLTANDGFVPKGGLSILSGIVIVIFAFVGAEIATIAAAESKEPGEAVRKATNSVISRVLVFYVLSVFLIVAIMPWNSAELGKSPFATTLDEIGIPAAAQVMNAIVLTAVLSCLNSGLYVASRMNFALARRGDAPQWMVRLNGRGVPARAILIASSIGFLSVIANVVSPEKVFLFLLNSSGAVALFVYLLIAVSQLVLRRRLERDEPERLEVRMWAYPYLTYFAIAAIGVVIASMALVADVRSQLWLGLLSLGVVLAAYFAKSARQKRAATASGGRADPGGRRQRRRRGAVGGRLVAVAGRGARLAAARARKLAGEVVADLEGRGARLGRDRRLGGRVGLRLDAERVGELAGLVHLGHDVAAADQLALDEQLGDRRPVRDRAQLLADARIREDVDRRVGRAERVQGGDRAGAEAAHGLLRAALHEEDDFVLGDGLGDLVADGIGRVAHGSIPPW